MNKKIILASASPRRSELLHQVGIQPEIIPSHVEEVISSTVPEQVVKELSVQKAADIAAGYQGQEVVVIGADTVVVAGGEILGKPRDRADAIYMVTRLAGQEHQVYTGVTLVFCKSGRQVTFAECTQVQVYPMSQKQIQQYVDTGEPMDKAGAYGIQGYFAAFVKGICGDYNNVVGLPVGRVCQELYIAEQIEKKIQVLSNIAQKLNRENITWCVGASLLLYFKGKVNNFNDIDIMVIEDDINKLKQILLTMGKLQPPNPNSQYRTKHFLEFEIEQAEVDIMAGFTIVKENREYDCSLKKEDIEEYIIVNSQEIPLQSLEQWKRYYELMGREDKVKILNK